MIFELEILEINLPCVRFRVSCSKGTYIRPLCQDIGEKLGCKGCMQHLKRTRVERFLAEDALTLAQIEKLRDEMAVESVLVRVEDMFDAYPKAIVSNAYRKAIDNGNVITPKMIKTMEEADLQEKPQRIRVYNEDLIFYGIYEYHSDAHRYKPYKMFF